MRSGEKNDSSYPPKNTTTPSDNLLSIRMSTALFHFFAPCPRGLESVLATELSQLGASSVQPQNGGIQFQGNWHTCFQANINSRIASRILYQVARGAYRTEQDLYDLAYAQPWSNWFPTECTMRVNLTAKKCPLRSLDFITLKIKDAICDQFRKTTHKRPSINTVQPDIRIHAFLDDKQCTLYLDTSGDALFKRGYRVANGVAPIRENLAAGILSLAGWKPGIPLIDPMCGSGTFLLEAAQIALNIAPGSKRHFAFEKFHNFDKILWDQIKETTLAAQQALSPLPIYGSDLYGHALADTQANLSTAGFTDLITLKQANVLEISAPASQGIWVTNPPYGVRIGELQSLSDLYSKLGDVLKNKFDGWNAYLFSADPALPKSIRLSASRRTPLFNGALECRLFEYKIIAGSMRKSK